MPKTHRIASPVLGPYVKWVSGFIKVSAESFSLLDHVQRPEILDEDSKAFHTFFNLSVNAEATSLAARVAATHSLAVPAFALARVRLEQCIISSFLIHAPQEEGIRRYLGHQPVQMNTVFKKYKSHFQTGWDMANLEKDAHEAQARFKDSRFKRVWTPLELPEMAARRDALAKEISPLPWKLADEYWSLYPLTSLAVHGASETVLWQGEFHEPELGSGLRYPYMLPERARWIMSAVARLDLIQAYETLSRLEGASENSIKPLMDAYRGAAEASA